MARRKKVEETNVTAEDLGVTDVTEAKVVRPKRIILKKDTELRKFPTLQKEHVVSIGRAGTGYGVQHTIGGIYGRFYKLDNGYYIVKNGDYTII